MKRFLALAVLALTMSIIAQPQAVRADFVVSGYSSFVDDNATIDLVQDTNPAGSGNAVVNFAVYENDGPTGNWVTDLGLTGLANEGGTLLGTGAAGVDVAAEYVYFYQVVNTGTSELDALQIGMNPVLASSAGYVVGTSLVDFDGAITNLNPYLGANPADLTYTGMPQEAGGNGLPTSTGGLVGLSTATAGVNPTLNSAAPGPANTIAPNPDGTGYVRFNFVPFFIASGTGYSTLLFITSSKPYSYLTSQTNDGSDPYNELPVPTPVPATLVLLASGMPGLLGVGFLLRRRRPVTKA